MISQFIITVEIPTNNIPFPSVYTTQGTIPPSLLCSPLGYTTSFQGFNIDWIGSLRVATLGTPAATTFII
jgi:hypothetical protein